MAADAFSAGRTARGVLRSALTGALATLSADGAPFASLVLVATTVTGEPILLLSTLAVHTRNLARDPRASLLLVAPGGEGGDPLAGARLSVSGTIALDADADSRRRFLSRHGEAEAYAGFGDFRFRRLAIAGGHLVAGFGRIADVPRGELLVDCANAADLVAAEASAVAHMNADHADALSLYATRLLKMPPATWRMTGADPEGIDLRAGPLSARLAFPQRVRTGGELRAALVALTATARGER